MKKLILGLVLSLGVVLAVPAVTFAAPIGTTVVSGTIRAGSNPLSGAAVSVVCNGITKSDTSDPTTGKYVVQYTDVECPTGATVTTTATKGSATGVNTGTANEIADTQVNVAVVNVDVALPEMGTIVGGATALAVGGGLLIMRRRQLGQN